MSLHRKRFRADELVSVARGEDFQDAREPELRLGDLVRINSGGPPMMLVDWQGGTVTAAWRAPDGTAHEMTLPRICVHRVRGLC